MADGHDRFENEGSGGGSFVMGLLTGTVLGAGLGMLFAPKPGSELRSQLTEQAGNLANTASEQYRRATEAAGDLADRGRDMYDKARDAVSKGAEERRSGAKGAAKAVKDVEAHRSAVASRRRRGRSAGVAPRADRDDRAAAAHGGRRGWSQVGPPDIMAA